MNELNVDVICANSPQAKGRVERANATLQGRLVKELRLRGISDVRAGQDFLEDYREDHNRRFSKPAGNSYDAHRPVHGDLDTIFTWQEQRRLRENLTLSYKRTVYVVEDSVENRALRRHEVTVHEDEHGTGTIRHQGRTLSHRAHRKDEARVTQGAIVENKRLGAALEAIAELQRTRDAERLASRKVSLREKKRIRARAGRIPSPTG